MNQCLMILSSGLQETPRTPVGELKQSSRNSCIPRAGRPPEGDIWSEVDRVSLRMNPGGDTVPSAQPAGLKQSADQLSLPTPFIAANNNCCTFSYRLPAARLRVAIKASAIDCDLVKDNL